MKKRFIFDLFDLGDRFSRTTPKKPTLKYVESIISDLFVKNHLGVSKVVYPEDTVNFYIAVYFFSLIPRLVSANELAETSHYSVRGPYDPIRILETCLKRHLCLKKPLRLELILITPSYHSLVTRNIPAELYRSNTPGIACFVDLFKSLIYNHNPKFDYANAFSQAIAFFLEHGEAENHYKILDCLNTLSLLALDSHKRTYYLTNQLVGVRWLVTGPVGGRRPDRYVICLGSVPNKSTFQHNGFAKAEKPSAKSKSTIRVRTRFCYSLF